MDPSESRDDNSLSSSVVKSSNITSSKSNVSRRSFLIKGAVSAPILASFVNKPLWAAENDCINSGSMSGNLSNHRCAAVARSADWWIDASNTLWNGVEFNGVTLSRGTKFAQVINAEPLKTNKNKYHKKVNGQYEFLTLDTDTKQRSLRNVLRNGTQVDRELLAALLNLGHPGIAYDGPSDPLVLIGDYQAVKNSYLMGLSSGVAQATLNDLFDAFAEELANFNRNYDNEPAVP